MNVIDTHSGKGLSLSELRENLEALRNKRVDLVVNSSDVEVYSPRVLTTPALPNEITEHGVGMPRCDWDLTPHAFRQWCAKFNVPSTYLGNLSIETAETALQDLSIETMNVHNKVAEKEILLRGFRDAHGEITGRAVLSPSYSIIENYDVLIAVFEALNEVRKNHNIGFEPGPCSVSDTHMRARINMPELKTVSEALLKDYVSPFTHQRGIDNPVVFMGIEIRNSEVGAGSFSLVPSVVIKVCNNGMTLTKDIFRKVHLGSAMDKGVVSKRTQQATMELISAQTVDKVLEIANPTFLEERVNELVGLKNSVKPPSVVLDYLKDAFDHDLADNIFDHFINGQDGSAFGVAQAITSCSQTDNVNVNDAMSMDDAAIEHAQVFANLAG